MKKSLNCVRPTMSDSHNENGIGKKSIVRRRSHQRERTFRLKDGRSISCQEWRSVDDGEEMVWKENDGASTFLAIHGWLDNSSTFDLMIPRFCGTGQRKHIICMDLAGHGRSDHRTSGSYPLVDYVVDVAEVVLALGWSSKPFGLIGHSLGGSVCVMYAGTYPRHVRELILIESLGSWTNPPDKSPPNLRKAIDKYCAKKVAKRREKKVFPSLESAAKRRSEGNVVNKLPLDAARVLCKRSLRAIEGGFVWASDSHLLTPSRLRLSEAHVRAFLRRVSAPVFLLMARDGMFDKVYRRLWMNTSPFSLLGRVLLTVSYVVMATYAYVLRRFARGNAKLDAKLSGLAWLYGFVHRHLHLRSAAAFELCEIESGGHHPHLTRPRIVCNEILRWRSSQGIARRARRHIDRKTRSTRPETSGEWTLVKSAHEEAD